MRLPSAIRSFFDFCRGLVSGKTETESLFGNIRKDSGNKWLSRRLCRLGITVPREKTVGIKAVQKSGNHSVRKSSIQAYYHKQYQYYLEKGYSPDKADRTAKNDCCVRLSHGSAEKRVDIVNIYLGGIPFFCVVTTKK